MDYRNPVFTANNAIDCEIDHPTYGWIPFTCDPNDTGAAFNTAVLYDAMQPHATPYTPPPPPDPVEVAAALRSTLQLSFAQLLIGLVTEGWITKEEGRAWRDRVSLPPAVNLVIASLPEEQQFAAETRALAPSEVLRLDPLVEALAMVEGKTPEELDQFFLTYQGV